MEKGHDSSSGAAATADESAAEEGNVAAMVKTVTSSNSDLLFKEIELGQEKNCAAKITEKRVECGAWRRGSGAWRRRSCATLSDGQNAETSKFQQGLKESFRLPSTSSSEINERRRGNFRQAADSAIVSRNYSHSYQIARSGTPSLLNRGEQAGCYNNSPAERKIGMELHPDDEGIPGFQVADMKEKLNMNSSKLLTHLQARSKNFTTLLKRKLGPNMIMLVVEILAKITTSNDKELQASLLAHSIHSSVLEQFSTFSLNIIAQNMAFSAEELTNYFENLYVLYNTFVQMMPTKATEILSDHCTRAVMALQNLKLMRKLLVAPKLEEDYRSLMDHVESLNQLHESVAQRRRREKVKREWQPGINFRELSVIPLPQDLSLKTEVNLCPAVIDGPYKSVEHYLDVQFNLMREDFLIPLREGIMNFIHHQSSESSKYKRIENVRFYQGVRFLQQFVEGDSLVTEVLFNPRAKSSRHNWSRSKRFLFGSLLCFSSDLFSSIILGLVVDRQVELLEKGILRCELVGDVNKGELFEKEFIMAESEVYFEAYQHVLKALQKFTGENFPLKEYLIDVSPESHYPTYLERLPGTIYRSKRIEFQVLNKDSWPSKEKMELNESQYKALQSALTKKCAVIQGPPGTGKTYLGLKIAEVLLDNTLEWQRGPILVVCYTNHALDQFLEGILSFTRNIVRIGSQSKNEKLDDYNLRVVRKNKGIYGFGLRDVIEEMNECTKTINECNECLKMCMKSEGIISLEYLIRVMEYRMVIHSGFNSQGDLQFQEWLFAGLYFQNSMKSGVDLNDIKPTNHNGFYSCSLYDIKNIINELKFEESIVEGDELEDIRNEIIMWVSRLEYMKRKLSEPFEPNMDLIQRMTKLKNLNILQPDYRWMLYRYWVLKLVQKYESDLVRSRRYFQSLNEEKFELMERKNKYVISESDVVGMTTTAAARHQNLLQRVGPKIVIVEEAAEVMESHVVVCLSAQCEHLILIGDHKQLRPSPAVYRLAKDYHLEISLFERLLMNGIRFDTLRIQHRMRPEIADLVFPAVYPLLENHPSVLEYDNIDGLKKNLFFITHTHQEEKAMDDSSKRNVHEAKFLVALCKHIILQGYDASQITILASYLGQMFLLIEERDKHVAIQDVRITVVDNFQGEENDIILLSLVRNNEEGKIGFLASENRTCVALSRAKKGLYIVGNLDMLADKSRLWSKIRKVLLEKEAVGTHLTLQCLKHPDQLTEVSKAEDFDDIPGGGCRLKCNEKMNCGHNCEKVCHLQDHDEYECYEICNQVMCFRDHRCEKQCWQDCGDCMVPVESTLPCGHVTKLPCHVDSREYKCLVRVSVQLPDCEHTNEKLCSMGINEAPCSVPCDTRLPCGHACAFTCHLKRDPQHLEYKCLRPCTRKNVNCQGEHMCEKKCFEKCDSCKVKVKKKLPNCEHRFDMDCSTDPSTVECLKPCKKQLDCGHACRRKCMEPCGGCLVKVEKEIPDCQHKIRVNCCDVPVRSLCREKCMKVLSCGHTCSSTCGIPCDVKRCVYLSTRKAQARCGHEVQLYCQEIDEVSNPDTLMLRCQEPCAKILMCGHKCKGTCGQCMQGRIHITCKEKCERRLICGHKCLAPCSNPCPPCREKCKYRCEHFQCKEKCGYCLPCKKKCGWHCEHQTCRKNCSDFCDRPPCNEPCTRKLGCGHECIGFCGERCPNLCRVCHPKEVEDALASLNATGDKSSRFVLLPDCGHVFESTSLEKSLSESAHEVKLLQCPVCHVDILQAYRYKNAAKLCLNRVNQVRFMVIGNLHQVSRKVEKLLDKFRMYPLESDFKESFQLVDKLSEFTKRNKKSHGPAVIPYSLEARMNFVLSIICHLRDLRGKMGSSKMEQECVDSANSLIKILLGNVHNITPQEFSDYEGEFLRILILTRLRALESSMATSRRENMKNSTSEKHQKLVECEKEYEKFQKWVDNPRAFLKGEYLEMIRQLSKVLVSLNSEEFHSFFAIFSIFPLKPRNIVFDLHEGSWYGCPNGRIFSVCGLEQGKQATNCNQCNGEISGGSHQFFSNLLLLK
ncbi:NFX1-type zinc finger-containing protein 1-like [Ischnura elegans]|uniref:NFX1-type zinc finger-containing protein 1-like n=2 Tax=Ischnura elegans TaxID=197161 RepID=UPI001ED8A82D|nr:NFX1-type zinc finger-containing protein 1-like [Ischnura elegans]